MKQQQILSLFFMALILFSIVELSQTLTLDDERDANCINMLKPLSLPKEEDMLLTSVYTMWLKTLQKPCVIKRRNIPAKTNVTKRVNMEKLLDQLEIFRDTAKKIKYSAGKAQLFETPKDLEAEEMKLFMEYADLIQSTISSIEKFLLIPHYTPKSLEKQIRASQNRLKNNRTRLLQIARLEKLAVSFSNILLEGLIRNRTNATEKIDLSNILNAGLSNRTPTPTEHGKEDTNRTYSDDELFQACYDPEKPVTPKKDCAVLQLINNMKQKFGQSLLENKIIRVEEIQNKFEKAIKTALTRELGKVPCGDESESEKLRALHKIREILPKAIRHVLREAYKEKLIPWNIQEKIMQNLHPIDKPTGKRPLKRKFHLNSNQTSNCTIKNKEEIRLSLSSHRINSTFLSRDLIAGKECTYKKKPALDIPSGDVKPVTDKSKDIIVPPGEVFEYRTVVESQLLNLFNEAKSKSENEDKSGNKIPKPFWEQQEEERRKQEELDRKLKEEEDRKIEEELKKKIEREKREKEEEERKKKEEEERLKKEEEEIRKKEKEKEEEELKKQEAEKKRKEEEEARLNKEKRLKKKELLSDNDRRRDSIESKYGRPNVVSYNKDSIESKYGRSNVVSYNKDSIESKYGRSNVVSYNKDSIESKYGRSNVVSYNKHSIESKYGRENVLSHARNSIKSQRDRDPTIKDAERDRLTAKHQGDHRKLAFEIVNAYGTAKQISILKQFKMLE